MDQFCDKDHDSGSGEIVNLKGTNKIWNRGRKKISMLWLESRNQPAWILFQGLYHQHPEQNNNKKRCTIFFLNQEKH